MWVYALLRKEISMRKNRLKFLYIILFFIGSTTILSTNIQTVNAAVTHQNPYAITRDNYIGWRYETINGTLYKRLYNYTTNSWIGEWIPV